MYTYNLFTLYLIAYLVSLTNCNVTTLYMIHRCIINGWTLTASLRENMHSRWQITYLLIRKKPTRPDWKVFLPRMLVMLKFFLKPRCSMRYHLGLYNIIFPSKAAPMWYTPEAGLIYWASLKVHKAWELIHTYLHLYRSYTKLIV